jgi:hypothetical protein
MGEFVYNLRGTSEEPLPEDNIVIECQAKNKTVVKLPVKFISRYFAFGKKSMLIYL